MICYRNSALYNRRKKVTVRSIEETLKSQANIPNPNAHCSAYGSFYADNIVMIIRQLFFQRTALRKYFPFPLYSQIRRSATPPADFSIFQLNKRMNRIPFFIFAARIHRPASSRRRALMRRHIFHLSYLQETHTHHRRAEVHRQFQILSLFTFCFSPWHACR